MLNCFIRVQLCATLWMVAHQTPLPLGFSRQEYWNGMPRPPHIYIATYDLFLVYLRVLHINLLRAYK